MNCLTRSFWLGFRCPNLQCLMHLPLAPQLSCLRMRSLSSPTVSFFAASPLRETHPSRHVPSSTIWKSTLHTASLQWGTTRELRYGWCVSSHALLVFVLGAAEASVAGFVWPWTVGARLLGCVDWPIVAWSHRFHHSSFNLLGDLGTWHFEAFCGLINGICRFIAWFHSKSVGKRHIKREVTQTTRSLKERNIRKMCTTQTTTSTSCTSNVSKMCNTIIYRYMSRFPGYPWGATLSTAGAAGAAGLDKSIPDNLFHQAKSSGIPAEHICSKVSPG